MNPDLAPRVDHQFVGGQFTAADKHAFVTRFIRFVASGYRRELFTSALYVRLSATFGNIAHYNLPGFYAAQFSTPARRLAFVRQCLAHPCYGSPQFTMCDAERYLQDWLLRTGAEGRQAQAAFLETRAAELAEYRRLTAKYGAAAA